MSNVKNALSQRQTTLPLGEKLQFEKPPEGQSKTRATAKLAK